MLLQVDDCRHFVGIVVLVDLASQADWQNEFSQFNQLLVSIEILSKLSFFNIDWFNSS